MSPEVGLPTVWQYGIITTGFSEGRGWLNVDGTDDDVILLSDKGRHFELRDGLPVFSERPLEELPRKGAHLAFKASASDTSVAERWGLVSELHCVMRYCDAT
jgi:hypothetical protein